MQRWSGTMFAFLALAAAISGCALAFGDEAAFKTKAAELLQTTFRSLRYKIKKYRIDSPS